MIKKVGEANVRRKGVKPKKEVKKKWEKFGWQEDKENHMMLNKGAKKTVARAGTE